MNILLFGKHGQVGWELNRTLQPLGVVTVLDFEDVDFSLPESLRHVIQTTKPDIICNAIAYTAVDKSEAEEDLALKINGQAPKVIAEEALKLGALFVHYSTDYVFDGKKSTPYLETDVPNPLNAYGRTKLAGEAAIQSSGCDYLILRTSWVYTSRAKNFLKTILHLLAERDELKIVADQIGAPTSARYIAEATLCILRQVVVERNEKLFLSSLYHLTASGSCSWFEFAEKILFFTKKDLEINSRITAIQPIATAEYPTPAIRPLNSRLLLNKIQNTFTINCSSWQDQLQSCIEELK